MTVLVERFEPVPAAGQLLALLFLVFGDRGKFLSFRRNRIKLDCAPEILILLCEESCVQLCHVRPSTPQINSILEMKQMLFYCTQNTRS